MKNIIYENTLSPIRIVYYLTIEGGSGHRNRSIGGTYKFVGGYFNPTEMEGRDLYSLEKWCDHKELTYVTADTFEELVTKLEEQFKNK